MLSDFTMRPEVDFSHSAKGVEKMGRGGWMQSGRLFLNITKRYRAPKKDM